MTSQSPGGLSDELQDVMRAFYRFLKQACGTGSKALVLSRVVESDSLVTHVLHELKRQYEERSSGVLSPNKMMF